MKKIFAVVLAVTILLAFAGCSEKSRWNREGVYTDEAGNILSITFMADSEEKGWYVDCTLEDESYGWTIFQKGNTLSGDLNPEDKDNPFVVTIKEDGEKDVKMEVKGGKTYNFKYYEMDTTVTSSDNTNEEIIEDTDGQNPVMNFIGRYASGRAVALVEAGGMKNAKITVRWAGSADSSEIWEINSKFDSATLSVAYDNALVKNVIYNPDGSVKSETTVTEKGTGSIIFSEEGGFVWTDKTAEVENMKFEWSVES